MSSTNYEQHVEKKQWKDWHESAAVHSNRDGHVTMADTEPRAFDPIYYIDSASDRERPISCLVSDCGRELGSVRAYNSHVTQTHYPDTIELDCGWCGVSLHRKPGRARKGMAVSFCSRSCSGKWHANNNHKHAAFHRRRTFHQRTWPQAIREAEIEGANRPYWITQRAELHENQRRCQSCGRSGDHYVLHSHHLLPVLFGGPTIETNLAVLCSPCHRKAEKYIKNNLDGHFRLPKPSDTVRIFTRESSSIEPNCCIHCDNDTGGAIPIQNRPLIPIDGGGIPSLTYPVCNRCYEKHLVYLYQNVLNSSMLLFGECPDPSQISYPDYPDRELSMHIPDDEDVDFTVFTDEELLDDLRQLADDLDRSPTLDDMSSVGSHSYTTYIDRFGTWNDAVRAAGLEPFKEHNIAREALLEEIHRLHDKLGKPPTQREIQEHGKWSIMPYKREFEGISNALKAAGYEPNQVNYTENELLEELGRLKNEYGEVTADLIQEYAVCSLGTYYNHFDSLHDAKKRAGVLENS